jgi:hypothetical protein
MPRIAERLDAEEQDDRKNFLHRRFWPAIGAIAAIVGVTVAIVSLVMSSHGGGTNIVVSHASCVAAGQNIHQNCH